MHEGYETGEVTKREERIALIKKIIGLIIIIGMTLVIIGFMISIAGFVMFLKGLGFALGIIAFCGAWVVGCLLISGDL